MHKDNLFDVKVFGALKAKARVLFRWRYKGLGAPRVTSIDAIQNLIAVWESISETLSEEAWYIYSKESKESKTQCHSFGYLFVY